MSVGTLVRLLLDKLAAPCPPLLVHSGKRPDQHTYKGCCGAAGLLRGITKPKMGNGVGNDSDETRLLRDIVFCGKWMYGFFSCAPRLLIKACSRQLKKNTRR